MKKDKSKTTLYTLIIAYITLGGLFIVLVFSFPQIIEAVENEQVAHVEHDLRAAIEAIPPENLPTVFESLRQDEKLEIAVYKDGILIYQSIPEVSFSKLDKLFNEDVVLREVQEELDTEYGVYTVWYVIHRPDISIYLRNVGNIQIVFVIIAFLTLLSVTMILRRQMKRPLNTIEEAIDQMAQYQFNEININEEHEADEVTMKVGRFATNLKNKLQSVSQNHTELEYALQMERERLRNLIVVARGIIHDIKTPIHQTLIENDYYLQRNQELDNTTAEIIDYNINRMDIMLKQINEVLNLLDTNVREMVEIAHTVDVSEMFREIRQSFRILLNEKSLSLNINLPASLIVHLNKVAVRLILHNMLSNAIKYAISDSEILFTIDKREDTLYIICQNKATTTNIERMKNSEELFNNIDNNETILDDEHFYSTGNGLYLIKELTLLQKGDYKLTIDGNNVAVSVQIPENYN